MERTFQNFFTRSAVRPINFMAESEGQVDQLHRNFLDDNFGLKYTNKYAITSVFLKFHNLLTRYIVEHWTDLRLYVLILCMHKTGKLNGGGTMY